MMKEPQPVLLAMVVCDQIIREEGTRKMSLLGLFNRVGAKVFPCVHSRMHIYVALTEYQGNADCELKFSIDSGEPLVSMGGALNFPNKLAVVEMNFCINNIPLPKAGVYHFDFMVNKMPIGHRKFEVLQI